MVAGLERFGRGNVKLLFCMLACAAVLFAACGEGDGDDKGDSNGGGAPTAAATLDATQSGGKKTYSAPPPMTIDQDKKYVATIKMDIGDIRIELFPKDAPETVNSFVFLAREGFYDGVTLHRVVSNPPVAQGGDPTGTGGGGPGYTIKDEVNARKFVDGAVGMAKTAAPNSAGSQFFIMFAAAPGLDGRFTVFGQIIEGRDVLDKIEKRDPGTASEPGTVMNTIEIEER